ncbi:MAG: FMN-binding negative transcriptional regulator [Proteobacteria bacterium]|nr:FMN-binding negative transcriptional regulator [Pseudomonadota bacterium]
MYLPSHFVEQRPQSLHALIAACPLATLITGGDEPVVNHVPFIIDTAGSDAILRGHVARQNPLWQNLGSSVTAIFHGPQAYISPSWYPSKARDAKVVPTWNYAVVHATGVARAVETSTWIRDQITALTTQAEHSRSPRWSIEDAPAEFIERMASQIVGIEITIRSLTGKFKLSQNRNAEDQQGVMNGLAGTGATAMLEIMRQIGMTHLPG